MKEFKFGAHLAAVVFGRSVDVDAVLASVVAELRVRRVAVGGLLQHFGERLPSGKRSMWLEDIGSAQRTRLDQPRGPGATGCTLDADALAGAAARLRAAIQSGPAILVVNRYGASEANGGGLRAEIAEAVCSGVPVLIAVRDDMVAAWECFLGAPARCLTPESTAIVAWADAVMDVRAAA